MENAMIILLGLGIVALIGYLIWLLTKKDETPVKSNVIIKTTPYPEDPYRYWTWAADWRKPLGWRRRWHH